MTLNHTQRGGWIETKLITSFYNIKATIHHHDTLSPCQSSSYRIQDIDIFILICPLHHVLGVDPGIRIRDTTYSQTQPKLSLGTRTKSRGQITWKMI